MRQAMASGFQEIPGSRIFPHRLENSFSFLAAKSGRNVMTLRSVRQHIRRLNTTDGTPLTRRTSCSCFFRCSIQHCDLTVKYSSCLFQSSSCIGVWAASTGTSASRASDAPAREWVPVVLLLNCFCFWWARVNAGGQRNCHRQCRPRHYGTVSTKQAQFCCSVRH